MANDIREIPGNLDGSDLSVAIVVARFNQDIGEGLLSACKAELLRLGVAPGRILVTSVPGALEIPLVLKALAGRGYDALVALGAVVRGETYHFEVVSNEMARGIMDVTLAQDVPVANGVLTTEDDDQALSRVREKGTDCARAAVEMANLQKALRS